VAVAFIQEFRIDDRSTTNYDAVAERLGDIQPDGLLIHTAGFDDEGGVFRIFDAWETREQGERFMQEQLQPILDELIGSQPDFAAPSREGWYELHDVMAG
jgi:hypothetical protein